MIPHRRLGGTLILSIAAILPLGAAGAQDADRAAAVLAVTPRTDLPPEADGPARPRNTRLLKPRVWVDDAGVDDAGNIYNRYSRSPFGTWSNYDEAKADPFPIPDALVLKDGRRVEDADTWWKRRRPEILNDFYAEVYGRIPEIVPKVAWEVKTEVEDAFKTKTIVGRIDNSGYPKATPAVSLILTLPANATGPVPVIVVLAPGGAAGAQRGRAPAGSGTRGTAGPDPMQQVLSRGWGYATFNPASVQPDNGAGLIQGVIGLVNKGQPRPSPDQWGALTAWTWGLSRAIDYFETDRDVDAKRLAVEGHSRYGKTALWAAAQDQRWAVVYASCSGEGGAKLFRRNYGETTDNIAGSHWMAANFRKYGGHWNDLPVDSNELIALVAPRAVFVTGATQDPWSDPRGEFLAAVGAGPVYRLLGKRDLGTEEMPAPNASLTSGEVAFREHAGWHTDLPDWPVFLEFAARYFRTPPGQR
jgi:hypothetical protein